MQKTKRLVATALTASLIFGTYGNVMGLSVGLFENQLNQEIVGQEENNIYGGGELLSLENKDISIISDVTLDGLFDVKSMEQGTVKHLYMNTTHEAPAFSVKSSDNNIVKATLDDGEAVKLEAIGEGNAKVTVTVTAPDSKETKETFNVQVIEPEHAGTKRIEKNINANWKFKLQKDMATPPKEGEVPNANDFADVSVPHSWNSEDGQDGGSNYHKGIGWYIKNITFDTTEYKDKKIYLEINGASKVSEIYVNGEKVGRHEGGYSIFRFDITEQIKIGEENVIAISVDNSIAGLTPLSGDFTVFGGLYRDVNIIATDAVHMDLESYGSTGLYINQKGVDGITKETKKESVYADGGKLTVKGSIKNSSDTEQNVSAVAAIYDADWKEVAKYEFETLLVTANTVHDFEQELTVSNPHLWDGVDDPYLYNVVFEVKDEKGEILDRERDRVGFRFYHIDPNEGFFLNGRSYPLRGVNSHQDRMNQGYAVSKQNRDEDMALMEEIGANTIRFAHYQHDQYVYEASDERGITVWAEIPMVNSITETQAFVDSTLNNMKELVYQGYNSPSIIVWGIHNEQWPKANGSVNVVLDQLYKATKEADPSRYVTVATAQNQSAALSWQSDVSAWNKYFGLYEAQDVRYFGTWLDQVKGYAEKTASIDVATNALGYTGSLNVPVHGNIGMSEYGVGSNVLYHEENPGYKTATSYEAYQTEEFQTQWHEIYYKAIDERPWLWGTYIWNMFEFGSDSRSEAGRKGINNKGLVSYDRELKKDVFYFYKANWSKQPTLQIVSERFTTRYQDNIEVKVYSNMDEVELFVNGTSVGTLTPDSINSGVDTDSTLVENTHLGKFVWDVTLSHGENMVTAVGKKDGKTYKDTVKWDRKLFGEPAISSTVCIINNADPDNRTISNVPAGTMIKDFGNVIKILNNCTVEFYTNENEIITDFNTVIEVGMKIKVISEDKQNFIEYTIVSVPISYKKKTDASEVEKAGMEASNAVDGENTTRWSTKWPGTYPQWLVVDLGKEYNLSRARSLWYGKQDRKYKFYYEVSNDGKNFEKVTEEQTNEQDEKKWANTSFRDEGITARYVRVQVAGCEAAGSTSASIFELEIEGFRVESDKYKVDNANKTIHGIQEGTSVEGVKSHLKVDGNYSSIKIMEENNEVKIGELTDNMTIVVTGKDNDSVIYTVNSIDDETTPISQGKSVWALNCTEGEITRPNEETLVEITNPNYAPAININDGNKNTRWSGVLFGTSRNIPKYPAQIIIDLGKEYNLNQLDISLFKGNKSFVDRYYQFKVYAGNDVENLQNSENVIWDMSDNRYSNQGFTHGSKAVHNKTGRYIMLDVINRITMSSKTQEASTRSGYHCASVFELAVEGYCFNSTTYTVDNETKVITGVPVQINVADFLSELDIQGNYKAEVTLDDEVLPNSGMVTGGTVLRISDSRGENSVTYKIATEFFNIPVSQGKKVIAEKTEVEGAMIPNEDASKGYFANSINDGDKSTRWSGVMNESRTNSYYPTSVNVELTSPSDTDDWYYLTGVEIYWFNSATKRAYQYNIVSNNPVGIPTGYEVNNTNNTIEDYTEHWVIGRDNRIKDMTLTVTGSTNTASYIPASAYELLIYGWRILSDRIDEESSTISLGNESSMNIAKLRNDLNIKGNCTVEYVKVDGTELTGNDMISVGDTVVVTDVKGNEFIYNIIMGEVKPVSKNIAKVDEIPSKNVAYGTEEDEIGLPTTVGVTLEDGTTDTINIASWKLEFADNENTKDLLPEMKPEVEPEVEPEMKPEVEPEVEPETKPEIEPEVEPETKPEVESEVEPEVEPETKPEVEPEVEPETKPGVEPEIGEIESEVSEPIYDGNTPGTYVFVGTLEEKEGVINTLGLTARVSVIVYDESVDTKNIISVDKIESKNVPYGTGQGEIDLPTTIGITLDDETIEIVDITSWMSEPSYDENRAGTYLFIGALAAKEGVTNTSNLTATVSVTVDAEEVWVKNIISVDRIESKNVPYGTTQGAIGLPMSVGVTLDDGTTDDIDITRWISSPVYNGNRTGKYTFTGILAQKYDITNVFDLTAEVKVVVEDTYENDESSNTDNSTVDKPNVIIGMGGSAFVSQDGKTVTVKPDNGYQIKDVLVKGISFGPRDIIRNLKSTDKVEVSFEKLLQIKFMDIENHWGEEAIRYLASKGIVSGITEETFEPNHKVTRAQFVKMLAEISGEDMSKYVGTDFEDVKVKDWFAPYVAWASEVGITNGVDKSNFKPEINITREQMAVMIEKFAVYMKYELKSIVEVEKFADVSEISSYAVDAVAKVQQASIIKGKDNNMFAPRENATRAETCKMLFELLKTMENK